MLDFIGIDMQQLLLYTAIALIPIMIVFLVVKGRVCTLVLTVAIIVLGIGVAAAYTVMIDVSLSGSIAPALGMLVVLFAYIIPTMFMLNFTLYGVIFNVIAEI